MRRAFIAKPLPSLFSTATLVSFSGLSSLRAQVESINALVAAGAHFFELGNRFLEESARAGGSNRIYCLPPNRTVLHTIRPAPAGADVLRKGWMLSQKAEERIPPEALRLESYIQAGVGDILSLGIGPIRLIATSGREEDLKIIDEVIKKAISKQLSKRPRAHHNKAIEWIAI